MIAWGKKVPVSLILLGTMQGENSGGNNRLCACGVFPVWIHFRKASTELSGTSEN